MPIRNSASRRKKGRPPEDRVKVQVTLLPASKEALNKLVNKKSPKVATKGRVIDHLIPLADPETFCKD